MEEENNETTESHQKVQRIWDLNKIGNFDEESWDKIFNYLSVSELAKVALVCKRFQTMAQYVFTRRLNGEVRICVDLQKVGWRPVVCRFKNVITSLTLQGPSVPYTTRTISFLERFMSETLEHLTFFRIDAKEFHNVAMAGEFSKLKELTFVLQNLDYGGGNQIFSQINVWCPNLKVLRLSQSLIGESKILEQSMPSLEQLSLDGGDRITTEKFIIFIVRNQHLKRLLIDLDEPPLETSFTWLTLVNDVLTNLQDLHWRCTDLEFLPNFRQNFSKLKKLQFSLNASGTYTKQLLKITSSLPIIEELSVIHCKEIFMSNEQLVELINKCSSTLRSLLFTSRGQLTEIKFGYDLHRKICKATSNRPTFTALFEFGGPFYTKSFDITKEWIKENGKIILLKD